MGIKMLRVPGPGKNLFSGGEQGTYVSTSGVKTEGAKFRSRNKIPVVAGRTYSCQMINKPSWLNVSTLNVFGYDAQGTFIWAATSSQDAWVFGTTFTMPANTAYITVSTFGTVVTSDERVDELNEKFIIVEGSVIPTEFEPYEPYLYYPGVTNENDGTRGKVDLGTLTWTIVDGIFLGSISDILAPATSGNRNQGFAFSSLYSPDTQVAVTGTSMHDMCALKRSGEIIIKNTAYTDVALFKAAMSGVYLYYKRSTDSGWTPPFWAFLKTQGGNE